MEIIIIFAIIFYVIKTLSVANAQNVQNPREEAVKQVTADAQKLRKMAEQKLREIERDALGELHSTVEGNKVKVPPVQQKPPVQNVQPKPAKQNESAMQQVREARREAQKTTIVERAKVNTDAVKPDVTLETMEKEHNHSERVSAAVHHHEEDVLPESMLGSVEDLMVKGYEGDLCFERDFVGEAMDMVTRFTV